MKVILRVYEGSIKALLRLFEALLKLYEGSIEAQIEP